jgi:hypothetical protein
MEDEMNRSVTRRGFLSLLPAAVALAHSACGKAQAPTAPSTPSTPTQAALPIYGGTVSRDMTINELLTEANLTPVTITNCDYGRGYVELARSRTGWLIKIDNQTIVGANGRIDVPSVRVKQGQAWKVERATNSPIGGQC